MLKRIFTRIPLERVNWVTSIFLMGTLVIALTCLPFYIWNYGLDWFQWSMFTFFYFATGFSITLGYHRLFSHLSFKAKWPVKLFVALFGAAAFENSILDWCSDHRIHHKHVDHEKDPYDITKGFWHAHIGWLIFKLRPKPPMLNVKDLEKDKIVMWQHARVQWIAVIVGMIFPAILGGLYGGWNGALGGFLFSGIGRIVLVQQGTFCINSLCHYIGSRPYSTKCSARDSWIAATMTFGEGYHNFHHEFQHDYRNGVKPWQLDPTKWTIWILSKIGLVSDLRRVPQAKILLAEMIEAKKRVEQGIETWNIRLSEWIVNVPESTKKLAEEYQLRLVEASKRLDLSVAEIQKATQERIEISKKSVDIWRKEIKEGAEALEWLASKVRVRA